MGVHLIGGGWDEAAAPLVYGPFLTEAGAEATVGCLLVHEGDGPEQFTRYATALRRVAPGVRPVPLLVPEGGVFDPGELAGLDGLLVGGGLTPAYQAALAPVREAVARIVAERGLPYAGFSAGAVVAARRALVGGRLDRGVPVCPDDAAEDLEEIEVRDGLGLVPYTVDVHTSAWGTLGRPAAAVARGDAECAVALDENTLLTVAPDGRAVVAGTGRARLVRRADEPGAVVVRALRAGDRLAL
ncbi:hypothetical protein [Streptomyces sp. CB02460]|uniref:hypothetical protein n=1 Tax=Streptomyces sp. CB02460 TaxID=1703941 RepID=UPI000939E3F3|nr:hypothetical protein [Streptomyces sp. CB02460]OKJ71023.1 hypothetical protein AMK30_25255 [Streptomyces sp. CB02460]